MNHKLKVLLTASVLLMVWVVLAPHFANYLIVEKPLAKADAIIVLSGSAVYRERTRKAAELYKQGVASLVFITDDGERAGWSQDEQTNLPYVELERRELKANGVAPDAIIIMTGIVSGTDKEAQAVAAEIDRRPTGSLVIVTSAYHTRRALRTFEKVLAGKNVEIGVVPSQVGEKTPSPNYWWLSTMGWQMVGGEYVKSVVYYFYY